MHRAKRLWFLLAASAGVAAGLRLDATFGQPPDPKQPSSYTPVVEDKLDAVIARMQGAKPGIQKKQADLLAERYDLADRPAQGVTMSGAKKKAVQEGVRAKLPSGVTWDAL